MPAPAVIPAPIVYFKVVAVKTLVVNLRVGDKAFVYTSWFLLVTYWNEENHLPFRKNEV